MAVTWATDAIEAVLDRPASLRSQEGFIRGLKQSKAEAFELLFALYRTQVYNLAVRVLHDTEEAKDATQETFLKALQQIPRQNGDFQLEPWLYRVAVNTCFDRLRSQRRHPTAPLGEQVEQASPTDEFARAETGRLVEETLKQLSERHRVALVLKDLHGFTHEEIAAVLGISRGAAETLLFRARESFRSVFEGLSPRSGSRAGCAYARSIALALVGRDVSPLRKRELVEHAKVCPACRRSLELRAGVAFGLGLFLRQLAPPQALGPAAALAAAPAAAAAGGAGSAGVLAKVAALFAGKTAIVAVAAAGATLAGGTAAYTELHATRSPQGAATPTVAAAHGAGRQASAAADHAQASRAGDRGAHGRSLIARGHGKGTTAKPKHSKGASGKSNPNGGRAHVKNRPSGAAASQTAHHTSQKAAGKAKKAAGKANGTAASTSNGSSRDAAGAGPDTH